MAESTVIKEFLVAIGYKHDEAAIKKIEQGAAQAGKTLERLALAATAAATTVALGVMRMASNLETLYFASIRTGASANNLKAFARAAQDFGASAEGAQGSVEGLARWLRANPSGPGVLDALLKQVGRSAFDANGHLEDTTKIMEGLGEFFAKNTREGNQFLNPQYADMVGIDERTMLAIQNGDFKRDMDEIAKRLNRAGFKHATEGAHEFMKSLRVTGDELLIFGVRVVDVLQDKFKISLDEINKWFDKNGDYWADRIATAIAKIWKDFNDFLAWVNSPDGGKRIGQLLRDFATTFEALYKVIKPAVQWMLQMFLDLDKATDGWSTKLLIAAVALKALGVTAIASGLGRLLLGGAATTAATTAGGAAAAAGGGAALTTLGVGGGITLGWLINKLFPDGPLARIGNSLGDWWRRNLDGSPEARRQMVYDTLKDSGATPNMAAAMMKVFSVESNMDPHAQGDFNPQTGEYEAYGIGQWHADRQADFERQFGHDMRRGTLEEQLQFALREKDKGAQAALNAMRLMKNQDDMVDVYVRMAERPKDPDLEISKANRMPNFQQSMVFHINEADNAQATAEAIKSAIQDENRRMFRELATPLI